MVIEYGYSELLTSTCKFFRFITFDQSKSQSVTACPQKSEKGGENCLSRTLYSFVILFLYGKQRLFTECLLGLLPHSNILVNGNALSLYLRRDTAP
jgi:hypothetical protein